jgi:hypothetical protein
MSVCHDRRFTPGQYLLNLRLEQAYFARNKAKIVECLKEGADIELPLLRLPNTIDVKDRPPTMNSCLPIDFEGKATTLSKNVGDGPVCMTMAGLLLAHSIDEKEGDVDSQELMACMFSIAPGGGKWQRQPRAWIDSAMPPGETSNTLIDFMFSSSRERGRTSRYDNLCVNILFNSMNMENITVQGDTEEILCEQLRYDDARSGSIQKRHLSLRTAMLFVEAVGHFPQKLLHQMSSLTYESFNVKLPLLHFLIDRSNKFEKGWEVVVYKAIEAGFNPNIRSAVDKTPLMHAAYLGKTEIVAKLLEAGADPDLADRRKWRTVTFANKPALSVNPDDRLRTLAVLAALKAKQKMLAVIEVASKRAQRLS